MKKTLTVIVLMCAGFLQLCAQGYIVPNGVQYGGLNPGFGYQVVVLQNPTNGDFTGFFLNPQDKTPPTSFYTNTFSFGTYLDEGVRVFLVSSNDPISLSPIQMQQYVELGSAPRNVFSSGVPFYVGLYTGYSPWDETGQYTGIYSDPLFGWARLVNNQGVIQLLDSALAYKAGGIYAGTTTTIPEPSTCALTAAGLLLLGSRRFRTHSS